jgi:hypothetical protein
MITFPSATISNQATRGVGVGVLVGGTGVNVCVGEGSTVAVRVGEDSTVAVGVELGSRTMFLGVEPNWTCIDGFGMTQAIAARVSISTNEANFVFKRTSIDDNGEQVESLVPPVKELFRAAMCVASAA